MNQNPIYFSDVQKLIRLFTQQTAPLFIFDPYSRMVEDVEEHLQLKANDCKVLVNLAGKLIQFKGFSLEEFDLILDFGAAEVSDDFQCQQFCGINHPNGKLRWLYSGNQLNSVLTFYNESGLRGKLIGGVIRLLSTLGLSRVVANEKLNVYSKGTLPVKQLIDKSESIDSIFMGTPGIQQSAMLSLKKENKLSRMLKIPLTDEAEKLLKNEEYAFINLGLTSYRSFKLPKVGLLSGKPALLIENLKTEKVVHVADFTSAHALTLEELHERNPMHYPLNQSVFWQQIELSLNQKQPQKKILQGLSSLCKELKETFDPNEKITLSCSHGDFTPWNILYNKNQLSLYDWELWSREAPALYDLFHFHYQRGILMQRLNYREIWRQICRALEMAPILRMRETMQSDIELLHRMYLLRTVSYFVRVYDQQELTLQNEWQINCWKESLQFELSKVKAKNIGCRKAFIVELNTLLQGLPHAFLKFDYESLNALPLTSDLDLGIAKKSIPEVRAFCKDHALVERIHIHKKSFMNTIELFFYDGEFLSVDLIHRFQRKELNLLPANDLLEQSVKNEKGLIVPALQHDLAYTYLFYTLNHAQLPLRYYKLFSAHTKEEVKKALHFLNSHYGTSFLTLSELFTEGKRERKNITEKLKKANRKEQLLGLVNYWIDLLSSFIRPSGFLMTFSGVDGAGKSTVLQLVEEKLKKQYRKEVVVLRHRPGILPILSALKYGKERAEQIASITIPRKGNNHSLFSSVLRFAYYYTDYLLGQLYVYFRYVARGKVVLYDRYYFDFINDARRSNIQINRNIVKALYALILKPKLNIFLYADATTILQRKQELNEQDILELNQNYLSLFSELGSKSKHSRYATIKNLDLEKTIQQILREFDQVA